MKYTLNSKLPHLRKIVELLLYVLQKKKYIPSKDYLNQVSDVKKFTTFSELVKISNY